MRFRAAAACCAAAIAVGFALAGCDSRAGAAASVGGSRISESDLSAYLIPNATPSPLPNSAVPAQPKALVLSYLVRERIYRDIVARTGAQPSDKQLTGFESQVVDPTTRDGLAQTLAPYGLAPSFVPLLLRTEEYLRYLVSVSQTPADDNAANAAIVQAGSTVPVWVSPRYGSWSPTRGSLVDAVVPDYLQRPSSASVVPAA